MPQVSVIIPIYGVEQFIARCAESLMRQSLQEVEYIFVDDATPDHSMEVLAEVLAKYPQRAEQVKILVHEVNKGLPAARNTGLAVATGEYIFHCDSDDFLETDAIHTYSMQMPLLLHCLLWSGLVFAACIVIDILRARLFRLLGVDKP